MFNTVDLEMLSLAQLAVLYNSAAEKPVNKFGSRQVALERVRKLQAAVQRPVIEEEGRYVFAAADAAPEVLNGAAEAPQPAPVQVPENPAQPASPAPEVPEAVVAESTRMAQELLAKDGHKVPTPYEIQQARKGKRSRKAAAPANGEAKGRGAFAEAAKIQVLKAIEAREGSHRAARYGCIKTGMTVGEYLDAAVVANAERRSRHRYLGDLHKLVAAGKISVA